MTYREIKLKNRAKLKNINKISYSAITDFAEFGRRRVAVDWSYMLQLGNYFEHCLYNRAKGFDLPKFTRAEALGYAESTVKQSTFYSNCCAINANKRQKEAAELLKKNNYYLFAKDKDSIDICINEIFNDFNLTNWEFFRALENSIYKGELDAISALENIVIDLKLTSSFNIFERALKGRYWAQVAIYTELASASGFEFIVAALSPYPQIRRYIISELAIQRAYEKLREQTTEYIAWKATGGAPLIRMPDIEVKYL